MKRWRFALGVLSAVLGLTAGVWAERLADPPHRLSPRAQAVIDGWRDADELDISRR